MTATYQIIVEAIIQENEEQKKSFQKALDAPIFKDLSLTIGNIKLSKEAQNSLKQGVKNALKNLGFDVDSSKAKEAGKKLGDGMKAGALGSFDEVASELVQRFNGVEDIRGHFANLGYDSVGIGKAFNKDDITQYNVLLRRVKDGWEMVDKAIVQIDPNVGHVIASTTNLSRQIKKVETGTKDLNKQAEIYEERLKQMEVHNEAAFRSENVQKYKAQLQETIALYRQGKVGVQDVQLAQQRLNTATGEFTEKLNFVNKKSNDFVKSFETAFNKIALWFAGTTLFYGTIRQLQQMVEYVKDLNKELTNVQVVTGMSNLQVKALAKEYAGLAEELGATTLEIAQASLTFVRQGKTMEESSELLKNSLIISKLAALDTAQASDYLTSIMNGYKMTVEETSGAIDKLVATDNAAATSVGELAEALSRSSSVAQIANVSFENLVAYIGTVSSITRRSAESIGEAFLSRGIVV